MTISWPTTPTLNQRVTGPRGEIWAWDGRRWIGIGAGDAPDDGVIYGRRSGGWSPINIPEIPEDIARDVSFVPIGGQLRRINATQIGYFPFNGSWLRVDGIDYPLSASGITATRTSATINGVSGQTLAVSTTYLVFIFVDAGDLKIDFCPLSSGHATSSTPGNVGTEIKTGDDTRTLIGIVQIWTDGMFYDTAQFRLVRSWLNRLPTIFYVRGTANLMTTAQTETGVRANIVCFANENVFSSLTGSWSQTGGTIDQLSLSIMLDGVAQVSEVINILQTTTMIGSVNYAHVVTEGYHRLSIGGSALIYGCPGIGSISGNY